MKYLKHWAVRMENGEILKVPARRFNEYCDIKRYGINAILARVYCTRKFWRNKGHIEAVLTPEGEWVTQL